VLRAEDVRVARCGGGQFDFGEGVLHCAPEGVGVGVGVGGGGGGGVGVGVGVGWRGAVRGGFCGGGGVGGGVGGCWIGGGE